MKDGHTLDLQGHPQWRRKVITVGLPFELGSCNFVEAGAFSPIAGAGDVVKDLGDIQEFHSCWKVIFETYCTE